MTDERWKECRHHHHGCACREHMWEEKVKKLEAALVSKKEREKIVEWIRYHARQIEGVSSSLLQDIAKRIEENEHMPIRCSYCGKFISYADFDSGKAGIEFTPDSDLGPEELGYICLSCNSNKLRVKKEG